MYNCISCEMWSAYKMKLKGLVTKVVPVLREGDAYLRNPSVVIDRFVDNGEVVYGEMKTGADAKAARAQIKELPVDFEQLDGAVDDLVWRFTNLFPGCLQKSIDGIRAKKKFFWDQSKLANRHWLAANMQGEAYLGFNAFNSKKITGQDVIDFIKFRQAVASGETMGETVFEQVLGKPQE